MIARTTRATRWARWSAIVWSSIAESNERVVELPVTEGEHVAAGALLARQEAGTMEPRLAQGRASLAEAEQRLDELVHGPRARELDEAGATLKGAESSLDTELREFERVRELVSRKLLPDSELDQARARRDVALASRDEARGPAPAARAKARGPSSSRKPARLSSASGRPSPSSK